MTNPDNSCDYWNPSPSDEAGIDGPCRECGLGGGNHKPVAFMRGIGLSKDDALEGARAMAAALRLAAERS